MATQLLARASCFSNVSIASIETRYVMATVNRVRIKVSKLISVSVPGIWPTTSRFMRIWSIAAFRNVKTLYPRRVLPLANNYYTRKLEIYNLFLSSNFFVTFSVIQKCNKCPYQDYVGGKSPVTPR